MRDYREEQLFVIGRITALKDMGFSLADIIKILDSYDDKEKDGCISVIMMTECKNLVPADPCLAAAEFLDIDRWLTAVLRKW